MRTGANKGRSAAASGAADAAERTPAEALARVGLVLAGVAVAAQTLIHLANAAALERADAAAVGSWRLLNANAEESIFTWASTAAASSSAFAALTCSVVVRRRRGVFALIAAIVFFLSLDDALVIHDAIGVAAARVLNLPESYDSVLWPAAYAPLLAFLLALVVATARTTTGKPRRLIVLSLGLMVVAVAAEVVSAPISSPDDFASWSHTVEGAVEEGSELGAWILLAFSFAAITAEHVSSRGQLPLDRRASP